MRPVVSPLRLAGLVAAAVTASCQGAREPDLTRADMCPYRTAAEWQSFLERAAEGEQWVKTCDDEGCDAAALHAVEANVASVFQQCAALLSDNPPLAACTDHLRRFTSSWLEQHDKLSYG